MAVPSWVYRNNVSDEEKIKRNRRHNVFTVIMYMVFPFWLIFVTASILHMFGKL